MDENYIRVLLLLLLLLLVRIYCFKEQQRQESLQ